MTPDSPPNTSPLRAPRRLWLWLAGLLLAFNAVAALPQAPQLDAAELRAAALTAPVPVNAHFRDPAAAIKAAAQRSLKAQDLPDGDPPLPSHHAALAVPRSAPAAPFALSAVASDRAAGPAGPYRARAPPLPA